MAQPITMAIDRQRHKIERGDTDTENRDRPVGQQEGTAGH